MQQIGKFSIYFSFLSFVLTSTTPHPIPCTRCANLPTTLLRPLRSQVNLFTFNSLGGLSMHEIEIKYQLFNHLLSIVSQLNIHQPRTFLSPSSSQTQFYCPCVHVSYTYIVVIQVHSASQAIELYNRVRDNGILANQKRLMLHDHPPSVHRRTTILPFSRSLQNKYREIDEKINLCHHQQMILITTHGLIGR